MSTTRVLVLSAHVIQMDRRIVAQANTLTESGREVTVLSLPTHIPDGCFDSQVRLIVSRPLSNSGTRRRLLKLIRSGLPDLFYSRLRTLPYYLGVGPVPGLIDYFLKLAPEGVFDVIHCHDLSTLPAALAIRDGQCPRARVIYDAHELFPYQFSSPGQRRYWERVERRWIKEADAIITVNESAAQFLAEQYGLSTSPGVIWNSFGTEPDPLGQPVHAVVRPVGRDIALGVFQGNFSPARNLRNLVESFSLLENEASLWMIGSGTMEEELKSLCREKQIRNVHFSGWVEQQQLLAHVAAADFGIIPYSGERLLNMRYSSPNKLFEMIAAEIPVCASDLPELRRIVRGDGIGEVYAMGTPAKIASALQDFIKRLRQNAFSPVILKRAREKYSWARESRKLTALYDRLDV